MAKHEVLTTDAEIDRALRAAASLPPQPRALSAHYDRRLGRIVLHLSSKIDVMFSPQDAQGLEGFGIHFPRLDADLYLPALLEGFLGSRKWMASRLGAAGGRSRSIAKRTAAKKNGRLGGRPKKKAKAA